MKSVKISETFWSSAIMLFSSIYIMLQQQHPPPPPPLKLDLQNIKNIKIGTTLLSLSIYEKD